MERDFIGPSSLPYPLRAPLALALAAVIICAMPTAPALISPLYPVPPPPVDGTPVSYEHIAYGSYTLFPLAYKELRTFVIDDAHSWASFWALHEGTWLNPQPPPPAVDFDTAFVVAVMYGWHPCAGYDIAIDAVVHTANDAVVAFHTLAGGLLACLTEVSAPFHIVEVPRDAPGEPDVTFVAVQEPDLSELLD